MKDVLNTRVFGGEGRWTSLTGGTVNDVWLVTHTSMEPAIVRMGPSAAAVEAGPSWMRGNALACEAIVLERVQRVLSTIPTPVAAGFHPAAQPWLVQKLIHGVPFSDAMNEMREHDRLVVWRVIGSLLRRVHGIQVPWFGTPDGVQSFTTWRAMVTADATGLLDDARRFNIDDAPFRELLRDIEIHAEALGDVTMPALVHSDLDPRHIFVTQGDDGWEISSVIDWEYARYVDPMSESLIVAMLARPVDDPERTAFLAGYELDEGHLVDPAFWQRQQIYRRIGLGWELTDAARLTAMIRFRA